VCSVRCAVHCAVQSANLFKHPVLLLHEYPPVVAGRGASLLAGNGQETGTRLPTRGPSTTGRPGQQGRPASQASQPGRPGGRLGGRAAPRQGVGGQGAGGGRGARWPGGRGGWAVTVGSWSPEVPGKAWPEGPWRRGCCHTRPIPGQDAPAALGGRLFPPGPKPRLGPAPPGAIRQGRGPHNGTRVHLYSPGAVWWGGHTVGGRPCIGHGNETGSAA
jgi:hypothetical protein